MTDKFQNKYRTQTTRLRSWDYGWNGAYFVTICVHHRVCYFGDVIDGVMYLSESGEIAQSCWQEIPDHFPFVKLGDYQIMPNHVHGIVIIDKHNDGRDDVKRINNDSNEVMTGSVEAQNIGPLLHDNNVGNDGNNNSIIDPPSTNRQPAK